MFVPDDGPGPGEGRDDDPLSTLGGLGANRGAGRLLGMDLGTFGDVYREVRDTLEERHVAGPGDQRATPSPEDRGPDRISEMPGGAEVLLRQRRARRGELLKEGLNVGAGVLGVFLVTGLTLLGWGLRLETAAASALAAALGYGYVLGREVLADLAGVRDRARRDADWG